VPLAPCSSMRPLVGRSKPAISRRHVARAGRAEQREELTVDDIERDLVEGDDTPECLAQCDKPNCWRFACALTPSSLPSPGASLPPWSRRPNYEDTVHQVTTGQTTFGRGSAVGIL
jgi:hypothetical protein